MFDEPGFPSDPDYDATTPTLYTFVYCSRAADGVDDAEVNRKTGVKVYFADPYSPWQRGSNENTNRLIRQYLPKGIDLSPYSQNDLDEIAHRLNSRPRKILNFKTPNEVYHQVLQTLSKPVALQN